MRRALSFALCLALLLSCAPKRPGLAPQHLVLITIENLRADHLSCYGYALPTTTLPGDPTAFAEQRAFAIDDLAQQGVVFAQSFAPSSLALPSLSALFTSRAPASLAVLDERSRIPRSVPSMGELAQRAGMRTVAFVSSRVDLLEGVGRGFETARWAADDAVALRMLREWLRQDFGDQRPTLLWLHLSALSQAPHDQAGYDAALSQLHRNLAQALGSAFDFQTRGTESTEFFARTWLTIAGVNGHELAGECDPGMYPHSEAALAVPLIMRHPDSLTGERVLGTPVELLDLLPTFIELFGWERPSVMEGHSLLALTDSRRAGEYPERPLITQSASRVITARTRYWRMYWNPYRAKLAPGDPLRERAERELYAVRGMRLQAEEVHSLHPQVSAQLGSAMRQWVLTHLPGIPVPMEGGRRPERGP